MENKVTILIVDDVVVNRFLIKEILRDYSNVVIQEADNGLDAISLSESSDIVLMDIMMPIMNGVEATKIIKEIFPEKLVITVTGSIPDTEFNEIFNDVIYKPFTNKKIHKILVNQ